MRARAPRLRTTSSRTGEPTMDSMIPLGGPESSPAPPREPEKPAQSRWLVPTIIALALLVPGIAFRHAIRDWWRGSPVEDAAPPVAGGAADPVATTHAFSDAARSALEEALDAYDEARTALARDSYPGTRAPARHIADALDRAARIETRAPRRVREALAESLEGARAFAEAQDIATARSTFARLSGALIAVVAADERLRGDFRVFECPMVEGENRWMQHGAEKANPYMGQSMPTCGTTSTFEDRRPATATSTHS